MILRVYSHESHTLLLRYELTDINDCEELSFYWKVSQGEVTSMSEMKHSVLKKENGVRQVLRVNSHSIEENGYQVVNR